METITENERSGLTVSWPKLLTAVGTLSIVLVGGYWALLDRTLGAIQASVAALSSDTGRWMDGREAEDRAVRQLVQESNQSVRVEIVALRQELGQQMGQLVKVSSEINGQLGQLRTELVLALEKGDDRVERRIDRLEENLGRKFDEVLTKIAFQYRDFKVPTLDKDGQPLDEQGNPIGTVSDPRRQPQPGKATPAPAPEGTLPIWPYMMEPAPRPGETPGVIRTPGWNSPRG